MDSQDRLVVIETEVTSLKGDLASLKNDIVSIRERLGRVEGIVDTIKWSMWLGFTLLGLLVSILRLI